MILKSLSNRLNYSSEKRRLVPSRFEPKKPTEKRRLVPSRFEPKKPTEIKIEKRFRFSWVFNHGTGLLEFRGFLPTKTINFF